MTLADVNVLMYAFRKDAPHHELSRRWLIQSAQSGQPFGVSTLALAALVRITTNARFNGAPSTVDDAFRFCDAILSQPACRRLEPGEAHWAIYRRLCGEARISGARTTDAWYAALAIEHDCEFITYDSDFARFPELRWRAPA